MGPPVGRLCRSFRSMQRASFALLIYCVSCWCVWERERSIKCKTRNIHLSVLTGFSWFSNSLQVVVVLRAQKKRDCKKVFNNFWWSSLSKRCSSNGSLCLTRNGSETRWAMANSLTKVERWLQASKQYKYNTTTNYAVCSWTVTSNDLRADGRADGRTDGSSWTHCRIKRQGKELCGMVERVCAFNQGLFL